MSEKVPWRSERSMKDSYTEQQDTTRDMTLRALNRNNETISKSILRGRSALAEAENHIKLFEDYLKQSSKDVVSDGLHISKDLDLDMDSQEQQLDSSSYPLHQISVRDVADNVSYVNENNMITSRSSGDDHNIEIDLINEMMKEEEERLRRDNAITAVRYDSDILTSDRQRVHRNVKTSSYRKTKPKGPFDPKNLSAAKRAILKAAIVAEDIAHDEAEMKKKTQFKARPLPNGAFVKNDPYALTKAALGKFSRDDGLNETITSSSFPNQGNRLDASSILNRSKPHSRLQNSRTKTPEKPIRSRKREFMKKAVYEEISDMITANNDDLEDVDTELSSQEEEDLASLHQQISKLQAELNLKRQKCIETIEQIDDRDDASLITCNADFRQSYTDNIDNTFSKPCRSFDHHNTTCTNKSMNICDTSTSPKKFINRHTFKSPKKKNGDDSHQTNRKSLSLYDRHNQWLQMREVKRMEAKKREDRELVKDVTGTPNLHGAQESWMKAKEQHDGLIKSLESKDKLLKAEKEEKERLIREKRVSEIERLKDLAKEKNRARKREVDKRVQSESVDKLARPNSRLKVEGKVKFEESQQPDTIRMEEVEEQKTDKNGETDMSFADMDDKEFAKMIRKLKAKASKGKRTVFGTQESPNHQGVPESERVSNQCEPESEENGYEDGRYTSSAAQAKIFAEISDMKNNTNQRNENHEPDTSLKKVDSPLVKQTIHFPYERYDIGDIPFFDRSSSSEKGRFRVRDAREFHTDSLRRIPVPFHATHEGVMFLVGKKINEENSDKEDVVTILFDRSQFDEPSAAEWWQLHRAQII